MNHFLSRNSKKQLASRTRRRRRGAKPSIQRTGVNKEELYGLHRRFKTATLPTLGVEIELFLLDKKTGLPTPRFDEVYALLPIKVRKQTRNEFLAFQMEYATPICRDIQECEFYLRDFLSASEEAALSLGIELGWHCNLPTWQFDPKMIYDSPRNRTVLNRLGYRAAHLSTCSMHVHVATPRDEAIGVIDRIQADIPRWVAMTANSPAYNGRSEVMASHRAAIWGNEFPMKGFPHRFGDWDGYYDFVDGLEKRGLVQSQKDLYLFARPTRFGTVEVRCCDLPKDMGALLATAADIHATISRAPEDRSDLPPLEELQHRFDSACHRGEAP